MKKTKTVLTVTLSVLTVLTVFLVSVLIAVSNKNSFDKLSKTVNDSDTKYNENIEDDNSVPNIVQETQNNQEVTEIEENDENIHERLIGTYTSGTSTLNIISVEEGYIEGKIVSDGISMEISAPIIDNSVSYSGDDSLENNVSITIVFYENNSCFVKTELLVQAQTEKYLDIDSILYK